MFEEGLAEFSLEQPRIGGGCAVYSPDLHVAMRGVAEVFSAAGTFAPAAIAARVERLCAAMRAAGLPSQVPLNQHFAGKLYVREILIPAGSFAIGEIQLYEHVSVISYGEISMLDPRHGGVVRIRAPYTCISPPGVRKCGFAHEDTVWTTIHDISGLQLADPSQAPVELLENFLVARTPEECALRLGASQGGNNP